MIRPTRRALIAGLLLASVAAAQAQIEPQRQRQFPPVEAVTAKHGMVVTQEARASRIGADILKRGGNAVDAAVAIGFTMAVTYPRAGNIGGGGFMVIHLAGAKDKGKNKPAQDIAIDYRETAPAATRRDVFLGPDGKPDPAKSRDLGLAIGVPGTVAGLTLAHQKYGSGKFKLAQLIAPAIDLARHGYKVGDEFEETGRSSIARMARWPSTAKLFPQARRLADRARHAVGAIRSRRHAGGDFQASAPAPSTKGQWPTSCPPRCARPAV
jgi:gamma-glutamyltranspeptidase/glutathione hydrolase